MSNITKPIILDETGKEIAAALKAMAGTRSGGLYVSLPDYVNLRVGSEFRVYFRNVLSREDVMLWVGRNSGLETFYFDEYMSISAAKEGTYLLPWKVYDKAFNLLEKGELEVRACAKTPALTTKVMVIGDSTVANGTMTAKVSELYANDGATLMLLGTRGNATHEGRAGWTAKMYCTLASSQDTENPFYNKGFDFAHYMSNQKNSFKGIQAVAIQLGINDIFTDKDTEYSGEKALGYIAEMVSSILDYDKSIKVIINLPITPNSNAEAFTRAYNTDQIRWIYNRNIIRFARDLREYFADNENVTVSASNCILDTETQINDGVHPTTDGYNALGTRLYEVLISITDGVAYVAPLIDLEERSYVKHELTAEAILPASTRELNVAKCYDASFSGSRSDAVSAALTYTPISENSLSLYLTDKASAGIGVEFPVALKAGKTYTLNWTADQNLMRVYLVRYNPDTTYNSNLQLGSGAGNKTATITAEEGAIYSVLFSALVKDVTCTYTDISLSENE